MFIDDGSTLFDHLRDIRPRNRKEFAVYVGSVVGTLTLCVGAALVAQHFDTPPEDADSLHKELLRHHSEGA